ncbi:MAG: BACON domain-containing protein, partial [Flavobacterium sp.]|nr:BACON domain-containing protein [Flavobacterium sp.]
MRKIFVTILCTAFLGIFACSSDSDTDSATPQNKALAVDVNSIAFLSAGNSVSITVTNTADTWTISSSDSSWIQLSKTSGNSGSSLVSITASANTATTARSATITVKSSQANPVQITVNQPATTIIPPVTDLYPSYNINPIAADATGMNSTA